MITQLPTCNPGGPAWMRQRSTRLGGSEIAAVLGLSPFESAFSLWHRKKGMVPPAPDSPEMEWGRRLEPVVAAKFFENHPELVRLGGGTFVNSSLPFAIATPDEMAQLGGTITDYPEAGLADREKLIVEIKTALYPDGWGEPGTDQIPIYYACQVRWYMAVLGVRKAIVAVLIGGSDYREYAIVWSAEDEETLTAAGRDFVASLRTGERPDIDGHSETLQTVRKLHPDIDGTSVDLPPETAEEYLISEAVARKAEEGLNRMKSTVLDLMGTAKYATHADKRIAFRTARTRGDGTPGTPYLQLSRGALADYTAKELSA